MCLRPTNGPLLNAPRNSTQFIMDDHQDPAAPAPAGEGDFVEYSERDFQWAYERARQEKVAEWDRRRLCQEMAALERRHRELADRLARADPEVYVRRLQAELVNLRETNRRLVRERADLMEEEARRAVPDSSCSPSKQSEEHQ